MPIVAADVAFRLSGGAANTSPAASLGGAMSTAGGGIIPDATLNAIWDNVSGSEHSAGDVEYRCIYVQNNHATLTAEAVAFFFDAEGGSADTAVDGGADAAAAGTAAQVVANEQTAPTSVTFSRPTTRAAGISLGNIGPASYKAVWLRRTVLAGTTAFNGDSVGFRVALDTAA
ncbi:MAG: hypothetical protein AVDCRST_MAG68-2060 [uncultured Gemmatimonadetes bacterium]|uniref:Uncharacterized protein n=1 Tax=uncultured Gemmatimonadota bacterium TaxID=203437 RepID=A0A6J4L4J3_9BACT|nr:MAG: hypothetical protein AVDCRST_MAG68-2060 [uncultured Gemmatimonadota bacterium]